MNILMALPGGQNIEDHQTFFNFDIYLALQGMLNTCKHVDYLY